MNDTMKVVRIHAYGNPDVIQLDEVPMPQPKAGEVLVQTKAASVNFLDVQKRRGELAGQAFYTREGVTGSEFPATIGSQGVGEVIAVGEGVTYPTVGDRVSFGGNGTYATHFVGPANRMIPVPDEMTWEQAAAGLNQGFLAYGMTHGAYAIQAGDWVLVQAAAGGIGLLLCQMAKLRGGKVIGVTSTEAKAQVLRDLGVDHIIVSTQADIVAEVKRITNGRGVQVVYDGVGKDTFNASLDSLAPRGMLVVFGQSSGYVPPVDIMVLQEKGSLFLTRYSAPYYRHLWEEYATQMVAWLQAEALAIHIDSTYPLAEAARAHAAFEQRQVSGRVLLLP